ncbi:ABC-2 type transport system permease protein [Micromonospora matsumotoense]|uniref:Transport permease protein n=1 Tax=Micromonospora matsumotoense TaxID=121616 RepID=A0A1C4Z7E5_9ACTN|nr:ABC transporter permease [Micromonospora matsumotoense]SCF28888.1 ABC-2 type transport system permease protein [Micromonospora matsumotoense]
MTVFTALTRASYKANTRDAVTIFFTFAFPLVFLVIFGLIFKGQEVVETGNGYIDFIAPGVLAWGLANAAAFGVAFTLMQWRRDDLLRLIRLTPARISEVVLARLAVAVCIGVAQCLLFIGVATIPLFGMNVAPRWPLALPIMLLGIATFLGVGLIIGAISKTPEAVSAIGNCVVIPMAFLSGAFIPVELMPDWLRSVSYAMPLRYILDGLVYALAGAGEVGDYWRACLVLVGFATVFTAIGLRLFTWSNDE